jgi:glycine C-acetyltransferase
MYKAAGMAGDGMTNQGDISSFSLADFYLTDGDDPLAPPAEFNAWRKEISWATSLYEQCLLDGPGTRASLLVGGTARPVLNFASYNYLGLSKHPETIAAAKAALDTHGVGACGSPILSGMTDIHRRLEDRLCSFLGHEATMLFNSGFGGAVGMLAGTLRRGDVAVLDNKVHISLIEGAKLSGARIELFDHNDPDSLDTCLERHKDKRRVVVTEGIFSMDGDMGDLPSLVPVAERHGVSIAIDEAHSILTCGASGRGVTEHFGMDDKIALKYATMSKAFATVGGFISGPAGTLNYLRYFANSYGFSCALPPAIAAAALAGLDVAIRDSALRHRLNANARYFRDGLSALGLDIGESVSQVVPIIIGADRALLYRLGLALRDRGLFLAVVDYPSVPVDKVRFRASVTADHTRADLDEALNIIGDVVVPALKSAA